MTLMRHIILQTLIALSSEVLVISGKGLMNLSSSSLSTISHVSTISAESDGELSGEVSACESRSTDSFQIAWLKVKKTVFNTGNKATEIPQPKMESGMKITNYERLEKPHGHFKLGVNVLYDKRKDVTYET